MQLCVIPRQSHNRDRQDNRAHHRRRAWGGVTAIHDYQSYTQVVRSIFYPKNPRPRFFNRLPRDLLDPNCDEDEGAQNDPIAMDGWETFHNYIELAKQDMGRGVIFDIHK